MQRLAGNERTYLEEVLERGFAASSAGFMVARLERAFAQKYGARQAIALCNGTATLHAILEAAGIGDGDEVIVPALTMASTSLAVVHAGALPRWADVERGSWNIDPESIRRLINARTRAIVTVALYGLPPDMDSIREIAQTHHLLLVEDNAQCFLGYHRGRLAGTLGDAASFSFQSSKHLTCGEGGIVLTDNDELAESIRQVACLGYPTQIDRQALRSPSFIRHERLGWNYRMSDLQAAVALAQVEQMAGKVLERIRVHNAMRKVVEAAGFPPWLRPQQRWLPSVTVELGSVGHSAWAWACTVDVPREEFVERFVANGGERPYACWLPNYMEPVFDGCPHSHCPVAEEIQPKIIAFQTNQRTDEEIGKQTEALCRTIESLRG